MWRDAYHDIIADMSGALYDTVSRPETAANGDSTGQSKSRHAVNVTAHCEMLLLVGFGDLLATYLRCRFVHL
jgi:hypothetical protein